MGTGGAELIERNDFLALGTHDCYAHWWLPHYETFLERLQKLGTIRTVNDVSADLFLAGAI